MKNNVVFACSFLFVFTHVNAQQFDSVRADSNFVLIESAFFASSDSIGIVKEDSIADSLVVVNDSFPCDSVSGYYLQQVCVSEVVTITPWQIDWGFGPYTYPWYPSCWHAYGSPCLSSYTVTVTGPCACVWIDQLPEPFRREIDLFNPPEKKSAPTHSIVEFNLNNFTPFPEEKKPRRESPPFQPDLKWVEVLSPTPFRSRN